MRIALVAPGGVSRGDDYKVVPAVQWLVKRLARRHDVQVVLLRQEPRRACWQRLGATVHNMGADAGRIAAVRTLLRLHRSKPFDVFHALWAVRPGQVALTAARLCRRPVLVHVAGGELVWIPEIQFGARRARQRAVTRFVLRHADRVTAASGPMLGLVERAGARPVRVPLGVDTTCWTPEAPRSRSKGRPARLVQVGSLTPVKNHAMLLRAMASLTRSGESVHADIVGEDTSNGTVQRMAHELGIHDRITFHGFLPQWRTVSVVRAADLMVVPSRHEAGPVAMLEAAAVGVPSVGAPVGHISDWAPDAAVQVPAGDSMTLARAIADLLHDDTRRMAVARRAQQAAVQEDADWTCARFEELYREVTRNAHAPATGI